MVNKNILLVLTHAVVPPKNLTIQYIRSWKDNLTLARAKQHEDKHPVDTFPPIQCNNINDCFAVPTVHYIRIIWQHLISINLHDKRPSTISTGAISGVCHGHVTVNVDRKTPYDYWVGFAFMRT